MAIGPELTAFTDHRTDAESPAATAPRYRVRCVDQSSGSTYVAGSSETTFRWATIGPVAAAPAARVEENAKVVPSRTATDPRSREIRGSAVAAIAAGDTAAPTATTTTATSAHRILTRRPPRAEAGGRRPPSRARPRRRTRPGPRATTAPRPPRARRSPAARGSAGRPSAG